jgi:hypothetical protein
MRLSRRHLLAGTALLAVSPQRVFAAAAEQTEALLALLPDRVAAAEFGARWMEQAPKEADAILDSLRQRLRWSPGTHVTTLRHNLAIAIGDDFRSGRIVKVEGWQIARTSAELGALAHFAGTRLPGQARQ